MLGDSGSREAGEWPFEFEFEFVFKAFSFVCRDARGTDDRRPTTDAANRSLGEDLRGRGQYW